MRRLRSSSGSTLDKVSLFRGKKPQWLLDEIAHKVEMAKQPRRERKVVRRNTLGQVFVIAGGE